MKHSFSYRYWYYFIYLILYQLVKGRKEGKWCCRVRKVLSSFLGAKVLTIQKHFRGDNISLLWIWPNSLRSLGMAARHAHCAIRAVSLSKIPMFENGEILRHLAASYNYEICASWISRLSMKLASANNSFANHIVTCRSLANCAYEPPCADASANVNQKVQWHEVISRAANDVLYFPISLTRNKSCHKTLLLKISCTTLP